MIQEPTVIRITHDIHDIRSYSQDLQSVDQYISELESGSELFTNSQALSFMDRFSGAIGYAPDLREQFKDRVLDDLYQKRFEITQKIIQKSSSLIKELPKSRG
jgi:hypothetical protein